MDIFTCIALIVVFTIAFLVWINIRIFLHILDKDTNTLLNNDMRQAAIIGACAAFLFYFFT